MTERKIVIPTGAKRSERSGGTCCGNAAAGVHTADRTEAILVLWTTKGTKAAKRISFVYLSALVI
jgi:hypothetical protein